jgi:hypothetical protein
VPDEPDEPTAASEQGVAVTNTTVSAVETILTELDAEEVCYLLDPTEACLRATISAVSALDGDCVPTVCALTRRKLIRDLGRQFPVASTAAGLIENGQLRLRRYDGERRASTFLCRERGYVLATAGAAATPARLTPAFVSEARGWCVDRWNAADSLALDTPARNRLLERMRADLGATVAEEFESALALAGTRSAAAERERFDPIALVLLVAAKHGLRNDEVKAWIEDVGLASASSVTERKQRLRRFDILDTESLSGTRTHRLTLAEAYADRDSTEGLLHLLDRAAFE